MKKYFAVVTILAVILTTSCSADESSAFENRTTATEKTTIAEQEEPDMEKYQLMITELPPQGYDEKRENIEYSAFEKYTYFSSTAERDTGVNVLLPPNYSEEKEYPVLYILHGYYDNEDWMTRDTVGINTILANLCADGEAAEMIVIAPYIYCSKDMPYCTQMDLQNSLNYDNFINDLTTDLMPFIESKFSVAKGRENTAITGFSMGGRESLYIGFRHPELFGYIGAVCPAPGLVPVENSPMHPGQMQPEEMIFSENLPNLLLISSSDSDGVVATFPDEYRKILQENNTAFVSHKMASTGHDSSSVKPHLYNFLRMIFQTEINGGIQ